MRRAIMGGMLLAEMILAMPSAGQQAGAPASFVPLLQAGRSANANGRFAEAETAFRRALELQEHARGGRPEGAEDTALTLLDLALNVSNQGRTDEAAALFRRAEPLIQGATDRTLRARWTSYLAFDAANRRDFTAARRFIRDAGDQWAELAAARSAASDAEDPQVAVFRAEQAHALAVQGRIELRLDDPLAAYAAASQAALLLSADNDAPRWWLADALLVLGEVSARTERASAAETYLKRAIALRRQIFGDTAPTIQAIAALGSAYQQAGLGDRATSTYREALVLARKLPSTAGVLDVDAVLPFVTAIVAEAKTAPPAARAALFADSIDVFQLVGSPVIDKTIAQAAARRAIEDPALASAVRMLQERQRAVEQARLRYGHAQSLPDGERDAAQEAVWRSEIAVGTDAVAQMNRDLAVRFPDYGRLSAVVPVSLARIQETIAKDEGIVSFLIGRERSFVLLITRDDVRIGEIDARKTAIVDQVTELRRAFAGGRPATFDTIAAHRLYDRLLGPLGDDLEKVRQLTIVSDGPLANLPFAVLVTKAGPVGDYRSADWLVRSHALAYTPSLQALVRLRTTARAVVPSKPMIGFGDPVLAGTARGMAALAGACRSDGGVPRALLAGLAPLPDTATELGTVATALGAPRDAVFAGARATEASVRAQKLADYRVIYFATHGLLPGELRCQAEPGLVLTPPPADTIATADGLLDASEIAGLSLNADLVVLSACDTAGGGGEALAGLAEAFLFAGARNLVVTHWKIASAPTARLMTDLFRARGAAALSTPEALRSAQLAALSHAETANPFYWGAFATVGEAR